MAACWPVGEAGEGRASFWDLRDRSQRLAGVLASSGVAAGDSVVIAAPLGIDFAVSLLAVLRLGAVAVPLEPDAKPAVLKARLEAASAVATVATASLATKLGRSSRIRIAIGGAVKGWIDAAAVSGSPMTGRSSGSSKAPAIAYGTVRHSHQWIFAQRFVGEFWLDLRRSDLHSSLFPVGNPLAASTGIFAPWMAGTAVIWCAGGVSIADWLARYPISTLCAPPERYLEILSAKTRDLAHLRHCAASGPIAPREAQAWREATGLAIHSGYGRTECPMFAAHLRGLPVRPGSVGKPFPGHDVLVVDAAGNVTARGEEGELAIRGRPPTLARDPAAGELHRTGVRARRDEQEYLWLSETLA